MIILVHYGVAFEILAAGSRYSHTHTVWMYTEKFLYDEYFVKITAESSNVCHQIQVSLVWVHNLPSLVIQRTKGMVPYQDSHHKKTKSENYTPALFI